MKTFLFILLLLAVAAGVIVFLIKRGKIKDDDHDFIPDVVEDKVADVKETVSKTKKEIKNRVSRVKEEFADVADAAKNFGSQSADVIDAIKGGNRKGRKPKK